MEDVERLDPLYIGTQNVEIPSHKSRIIGGEAGSVSPRTDGKVCLFIYVSTGDVPKLF